MTINFTALAAASKAANEKAEIARLDRIYTRRYYGLLNAARKVFKTVLKGQIETLKESGLWEQYIVAPGYRDENGGWTQPEINWKAFWQDNFQVPFEEEYLAKTKTIKGLERAINKIARAFHNPEMKPVVEFLGNPEDGPAWLAALEEFNRQCFEARKVKETNDD